MNTIETIKQLRNETGAGVMACQQALEQSGHNYDQALVVLRDLAVQKAGKHTNHETINGRLELYSHNNGRIGVMLEINTETDFASRSELFLDFAREIALQITATSPLYVCDEDIPQDVLLELSSEASAKARSAGKPEAIIEKIVAGVIEKYRDQTVLLRQAYLRDENITITRLLEQKIGQIGENIVIRRFIRWEITPDSV